MPTQREIYEAMLLDANGVGSGRFAGGGGSVDHARSMEWAKFQQSNLGRLLASNPQAQRAMFEQQRYGGGFPFQYGQTPNQADLNRWIDKAMGVSAQQGQRSKTQVNPPGSYLDAMQQNGGQSMQQSGGPAMDPMSALLVMGAIADDDARNAAVRKRETEIRQGMDDLYSRVMGRVDNYNKAEAELIKENAAQRISSGEARRARNGLGNTTINDAFREQIDRNKSLQLQDLSEDTDERAIQHDMALTRDKNRFIEDITDRSALDTGQIINLMQQLGLAGGGGMLGGASQRGGVAPVAIPASIAGQRSRGPTTTPWGPVQYADPFGGMFRQPIAANPMLDPRNPMAAIGMQQQAVNQIVPQPQSIRSRATIHWPSVEQVKRRAKQRQQQGF